MTRLELDVKSGSTKILIGESLDRIDDLVNASRVVVVTDSRVGELYRDLLRYFRRVEIGVGENSKTISSVEKIFDYFLEQKIDRTSFVLGIGGGVVTDVTGFAASTFMRGVKFGFVPTTLLAQVDASLGGKNGVNFRSFKNMVGVIRQPEFCLVDFDFLATLPKKQIISGMAEMVKSGAISDVALFDYIEDNYHDILSLDRDKLSESVSATIRVKMKFVQEDELESRERMKLNFGHSVGHAIEKVTNLPHGYAVSIGMVAAARLSVTKGLLHSVESDRIENLVRKIGLPNEVRAERAEVLKAIAVDKKSDGESINMILLSGIGSAVIRKIRKEELKNVLKEVCN